MKKLKESLSVRKLNDFLLSLSSVERRMLDIARQNANYLQDIQNRFTISNKEFAKHLEIKERELHKLKNGLVDFDLKFLAKVEAFVKDEIEHSKMINITLKPKHK